MSKILKIIIAVLLCSFIAIVTIIPKLLSFIWYGKWTLDYTNAEYITSIAELVSTIVEQERY